MSLYNYNNEIARSDSTEKNLEYIFPFTVYDPKRIIFGSYLPIAISRICRNFSAEIHQLRSNTNGEAALSREWFQLWLSRRKPAQLWKKGFRT